MVLSLASLNLHCGLDHAGAPFPVKAAIAALDTDVVLIQENWRPHGAESLAAQAAADCGYPCFTELDLVTDSPLADLDVVRGEVPDETGAWGLAIMSRVPWRSVSTVSLGPAAPRDVVGERHALVVDIPLGDTVLRVADVHLTHRLAHGPGQLRRLVAGLRAAGDDPTVIAGDLNMFRPTVYLARPYRPVVRGRTWPARRPLAQLDHVLIGPGVRVTAAGVALAAGSDHLPIRVTVDGRPGCPGAGFAVSR